MTIQFTKGMNPATITLANLQVQRQGGTGNWNTPINLSALPGAKVSYNSTTNTATLDFSGLSQTSMPTDQYRIVVKSGPTGVTDLVGNQLDGEFSGVFPSGDSKAGGDFVQDLGLQVLGAPIVTSFQMTAATDTGIASDQNTKLSQPVFIGQVFNGFPGTVANLQVYIQFAGLHSGTSISESAAAAVASRAAPTSPSPRMPRAHSRSPRRPDCRKDSRGPRSWSSGRPTSLRCRASPRRSSGPSASIRLPPDHGRLADPRRHNPPQSRSAGESDTGLAIDHALPERDRQFPSLHGCLRDPGEGPVPRD